MLSPIVPYSLLKMHWNPEHAQPLSQWPEQHLDVSSTTSSPAHKPELYPSRGSRSSYSYAWANDDISALTASNLLKRYAEKYSGVLDSPYERPAVGTYTEPGAFGTLNGGQKSELEPWPLTHSTDGTYPLVPSSSAHDGLTGPKIAPSSAGLPGSGTASAVSSNLSDSGYSGSSSCSGPHSSDYPPSYNGTYLSSGYCPQASSALPSASLHTLQSTPTLVPSYTPSAPVYNYPPSTYPHQTSLAPTYSHPSGPYLPSGIAAPTPIASRPGVIPAGATYGYQNSSLGNSGEPGSSLKRKAFEMTLDDEDSDGSRYRKYSYDPMKSGGDSPYAISDKGECRGNGFITAGADQQQAFKPSKPSAQVGLGVDEAGKYGSLKPLLSPPYGAGGGGEYSPPAALTGENRGVDHGFSQQHRTHKRSESALKGSDPRLLDMVNGELQDCTPAVLWSDLAGHNHIKAAVEEELLWPLLRPNPASRPPKTVLMFGPRGGGKTTLSRSVASQLGATFYRLSCATLVSKWKGEAEQLLSTLFSTAVARQSAVVLINEVEAIEDEAIRQQLQVQLEKVQHRQTGLLLVVCSTRQPDLLKESLLRCFTKRYHVGLPDGSTRRQVLLQALAPQGCGLSERELAAILQRAEGFSVWELLQLCQQALASASASVSVSGPGQMHGLSAPLSSPAFKDFENAFCKVRPHGTPKEPDTCMEWSKVYSH